MLGKLKNIFGRQVPDKGLTVLVVEDSQVDQRLVVATLERAGYKALLAENGQAGVDMAKAQKPDLILMDCEMPVMGGVAACEVLKEDEQTKNIPVIFLTSLDTPKNVVDCFEKDAENFLTKPVNPSLLLKEIEGSLKRKTS